MGLPTTSSVPFCFLKTCLSSLAILYSLYLLDKLQQFKKSTARLILQARQRHHVNLLFLSFSLVSCPGSYTESTFFFWLFVGSAPSYTPSRHLSTSVDSVSRFRSKLFVERLFAYSASICWNSLPFVCHEPVRASVFFQNILTTLGLTDCKCILNVWLNGTLEGKVLTVTQCLVNTAQQ